MVPQTFRQLVRTHLHRLDQTLTPGLTQITWSSLNVPAFLGRVEAGINSFETFVKDVSNYSQHMSSNGWDVRLIEAHDVVLHVGRHE